MIGPILSVTVTVPDLGAIETAYRDHLGYRLAGRGTLPAGFAAAAGADEAAGAPVIDLLPAAGDGAILRFVQQAPVPGYKPLTTRGWNSIEINVADVYALEKQLADSPFEIIGPAKPLGIDDNSPIVAMQVIGPGGEVLYLTEIPENLPGYDLPVARSPVDRVFIMVLGGADIASQAAFFKSHFGIETGAPMEAKITVISNAMGQPPNTTHQLAVVGLNGRNLVEIDALPDHPENRPKHDGWLVPGIAAVAMAVDDLDAVGGTAFEDERGAGKLITGAGGALFELRQTSA